MPINNSNVRYPILNFKREFCPLLMNRLYPFIKWIAELDGGKFLLLLNMTDRSTEESVKEETLLYGGFLELRKFIEPNPIPELTKHWIALKNGIIAIEDSIEGGKLYNSFRSGTHGLECLGVNDLRDYFAGYFKSGNFGNDLQKEEYPILKTHFSLQKDHFLSLPLILFGKLEGVVHLVFESKLKNKLNNQIIWKNIIRGLSVEYESLLLTWDLVGGDFNLKSLVEEELKYVTSNAFQNASDTNKFFKQLNSRQYYLESYGYYLKRIEQNTIIPDYIKREHRRRAIISILIDSYAHNISAHSLTVLKWWFQQRASLDFASSFNEIGTKFPIEKWGKPIIDFLMETFPDRYEQKDIAQGLKYDLARWYGTMKRHQENADFKAVRDQFFSLERQLTPLFKFLLEKGAFWSGVTRDQQFGGEIHNLYEILWGDFIQNPLYLGTIAYSEGITRLNIHIRMYVEEKERSKGDNFHWLYQLKKNEAGLPLDGVLAKVDIGGVPFQPLQHHFVEEGVMHAGLKKALLECEIFFPGGVVGKHAFFTLLENEIRNVKHYEKEDLEKMRQNGLDLVISIRPSGIGKDLGAEIKSLYKIGIWLGHSTKLKKQSGHLVLTRFMRLMEDIITPDTNEARLGGTYQDKICAAMLFNNTFISVEAQDKDRDKAFYPWVRTAFSKGLDLGSNREEDFEIDINNHAEALSVFDEEDLSEVGFFKKYVHLWRGDFIVHLVDNQSIELENVNRFRIVNVIPKDENVKLNLQKVGVIRILENQNKTILPIVAYHHWLKKWFKESKFTIRLFQGKTEIAYIFFDDEKATYLTKPSFFKLPEWEQEEFGEYLQGKSLDLKFAHHDSSSHTDNTLGIRSHGILRQKFFPNVESVEDFSKGQIGELELYELTEVLKTRICIFDKRIADRIPKEKCQTLNEQLSCDIYGEELEKWQEIQKQNLAQYHFIIMHLSFIEAMPYIEEETGKGGKRYGEEGIVDFVEEQLSSGAKNKVILNDNTILIITTGRGRTAWWRKLQNSQYAPFSTFRPVESLIEAVEKAVLKNDYIELKYNLMKVLFGS